MPIVSLSFSPLNFRPLPMPWSNLLLSFYILICLFFLDNTYREGEAVGGAWDKMRVLGLSLCLLWPLILVHVIISACRNRQAG
jgi:hypothetical protein